MVAVIGLGLGNGNFSTGATLLRRMMRLVVRRSQMRLGLHSLALNGLTDTEQR